MRGLADEPMPGLAVALVRAAGHDMAWVAKDMPSAPDAVVLERAMRENRVVITYDKSAYGRLIYQDDQPAQCGVVLFRFRGMSTEARCNFIVNVLSNEAVDWRGSFTAIRTGPAPGA